MPILPMSTSGQTRLELGPGGAGVGRFVDPRLGATVDQGPDMAPALVGRSVEHIGVARVHQDLVDAGVIGDVQDPFPGRAAVGGLVETAFAAGFPQRSLGCYIDDFGVTRIDDDVADVLGFLQPGVGPARAAVVGAIDPVAEGHRALAVVFAGADPDGVEIGRIQGQAADGVRALGVEDRRPGGAVVDGFPQPARGGADIDGLGPIGLDREIGDPAGVVGRTDEAERETRQRRIGHERRGFIFGFGLRFLGEDIGGGQKDEDRKGQNEESAHGFPSQE